MLENPSNNHNAETDPFVLYARSLHDYTLKLWTESRKVAEEKSRQKKALRTRPLAQDGKHEGPSGTTPQRQ